MACFHYFRNEELAIAKWSKLLHRMRKREKQLLFLNDDSSMKFILLTILALLYPVGWWKVSLKNSNTDIRVSVILGRFHRISIAIHQVKRCACFCKMILKRCFSANWIERKHQNNSYGNQSIPCNHFLLLLLTKNGSCCCATFLSANKKNYLHKWHANPKNEKATHEQS